MLDSMSVQDTFKRHGGLSWHTLPRPSCGTRSFASTNKGNQISISVWARFPPPQTSHYPHGGRGHMEDYHLQSLVDDLGVSLADVQSEPVVPCRGQVDRRVVELPGQETLPTAKTASTSRRRQRPPETVPLRLMKRIGWRCHERAEAAWRWCDRTVKSVDGPRRACPTRPPIRQSILRVGPRPPGWAFDWRGWSSFPPGNGGRVGVGDRPCPRQENRRKHYVPQPLGQPGRGRRRPGRSLLIVPILTSRCRLGGASMACSASINSGSAISDVVVAWDVRTRS